jgi:catechol 2,3-dioxygenase
MGVSTHDIFGDTPRDEPATPGSYGRPPAGGRLPDALRLGPVRLQVADLERSLSYYPRTLGLRIQRHAGTGARLGPHGAEHALVELVERPGARPAPRRGRLGLFHFAIVLPDRPSLGRFLTHLSDLDVRVGAADHLVSEALYLQDPDDLGIEIYADRPRSSWRRVGRELMMATDPLDATGIVASAGDTTWTGMPAGAAMGHVHLHVGDLARAAQFYAEALGFDRTVWEYPGALFLSAGGYHHHLGTNTWAGAGATPPAEDEAQLLEWTIELPTPHDVEQVAGRLIAGGHPVGRTDGGTLTVRDPWGTPFRLRPR